MPRRKNSANGSGGESIAGYFRKILEQNRRLLHGRSNAELLQRWKDDHPGQELTKSVKVGLANIKSILRSKGRRRKKRQAEAESNAAGLFLGHKPKPRLSALEEAIDECMMMAKAANREVLEPVIELLRRARNLVVWRMGQPK